MNSLRPAVFFDRDGVLNRDVNYAFRPDQIVWMDGVFDAIRRLTQSDYRIFVVTNQAGVARGFYGEEDIRSLHRWMADRFSAEGGRIDDFRYCPHHSDGVVAEYTRTCSWRKPEAGMLLDLMKHWEINKDGSFLIGDKQSDLEAANAAGITGHLFGGGNLDQFVARILGQEGLDGAGKT